MSAPLPALTLVLGGIRSGKSAYAEELVAAGSARATYLATAESRDAEMAERIRRHRERRGEAWTTVEEPLALPAALAAHAAPDRPMLVDSLGVWLANLLESGLSIGTETNALLAALDRRSGPVVMVSDEVGLGGISANAAQRRFADALGTLNQAVAARADMVVLVTAGLPMVLKEPR